MFFQRKKNLTKRLWSLRVSTITPSKSHQSPDEQAFQAETTYQHNQYLHLQQQQQQQHQHQLQLQQQQQQQHHVDHSSFMSCCGGGGGNSSSGGSDITTPDTAAAAAAAAATTGLHMDEYRYGPFCALNKKLKDSQKETLCQAIKDSFDGQSTGCVLVNRGHIAGNEPHMIACLIWRWPDLMSSSELKRIPSCPAEIDSVYACCNPSHWSRLSKPDTPPPPYCLYAMDRLRPEDRAPSEPNYGGRRFPGSLTTDGEDDSGFNGWCQLAYWELSQRVGRLFHVVNSAVNIFSEQTRGDGLCLKTLAAQRLSKTPDAVLKARQKNWFGRNA